MSPLGHIYYRTSVWIRVVAMRGVPGTPGREFENKFPWKRVLRLPVGTIVHRLRNSVYSPDPDALPVTNICTE
jgi:hypothetical protein